MRISLNMLYYIHNLPYIFLSYTPSSIGGFVSGGKHNIHAEKAKKVRRVFDLEK